MKQVDQETRRLILQLHEKGVGLRRIARLVSKSRPVVKKIIASGTETPPNRTRKSLLDEHREEIVRLIMQCRGNLTRVHEELVLAGVAHGYNTLADYVRKHQLKQGPKLPAGRYTFEPGKEMQFDTSPHRVIFASGERGCQCASLVLCYSRGWFFQYYPRFTRLECKAFLSTAVKYLSGAAEKCMIDNTNLVVLHGTGPDAVITPEMEAFGKHFGFEFVAHAIGDANRSGRVERRFHYAENNFLAGRVFKDFADLNKQAVDFCDRVNNTHNRRLEASPVELLAAEQPALRELPPVFPEVYQVSYRTVDVEGYVHLNRNMYSVPYELIGRQVEVRESLEQVRVYHGPFEVAVHPRLDPRQNQRVTDKKHRPNRRRSGSRANQPIPEERQLREADPVLDEYVTMLRKSSKGRGVTRLRRLYRMLNEYPSDAFLGAVRQANKYGMLDLERLEKMILRNVAGRFFPDRNPASHTPEGDNE